MNRKELANRLTNLYREYLGVAAEFVIEDVLIHMDEHPEWRTHPQLMRAQFLVALERLTPREVPYSALRASIAKLVAESDL